MGSSCARFMRPISCATCARSLNSSTNRRSSSSIFLRQSAISMASPWFEFLTVPFLQYLLSDRETAPDSALVFPLHPPRHQHCVQSFPQWRCPPPQHRRTVPRWQTAPLSKFQIPPPRVVSCADGSEPPTLSPQEETRSAFP